MKEIRFRFSVFLLALPDQKGRGKDLCKEPKQEEHSYMPLGSSTHQLNNSFFQ